MMPNISRLAELSTWYTNHIAFGLPQQLECSLQVSLKRLLHEDACGFAVAMK